MKNINRRIFLAKSLTAASAAAIGAETLAVAFASDAPADANQPTKPDASRQVEVEYGVAIKKKYPEQLIFTIAKDKNGRANPVTMGWTMITSGQPPMMAVSMSQGHYTVTCVRHSKCFTICFPSAQMAEAALFFGTHSGWRTDKLTEFECPHTPAKKIDSILFTDAVANFECQLENEFVTGDHIIFVGRIVASHINAADKKRLYILGPGRKLGPVS